MATRCVFGPVPSRRLGLSLGVDPLPFKTCNWNCVYCQLGHSTTLVTARRDWIPVSDILRETEQALDRFGQLARAGSEEIDWITIAGSGEPTLVAGLGELIRGVRSLTDTPLAVITNGSLLFLPEVRADLAPADAVMPTLDAGNEALYRRINRGAAGASFGRLVTGLEAFSQSYRGRLWVEVMLLAGRNDTDAALEEIAEVLERIAPDAVHVTVPTRPPALSSVTAPGSESVERAVSILGRVAPVMAPGACSREVAVAGRLDQAIAALVARHPMSTRELTDAFATAGAARVERVLDRLCATGRVRLVTNGERRFWCAAEAHHQVTRG